MKKLLNSFFFALVAVVWASPAFSQCETWVKSPQKDALEEAHVLYRQFIKSEEYDKAFEYWQKAYAGAPAADGLRSTHYKDGRTIYIHKFKNEKDEAKKKEHAAMIIKLFDQQVQCYPKEKALTLGLKAYEMFYTLNSPYSDNLKACQEAVAAGGENTSYVVFQPYTSIAVYQYQNKQMDAEQARQVYTTLNEVADHNINNHPDQSAYYKQAKDAMNATFAQIENEIFDCNYFKTKLEPDYRAHAGDTEVLKYIYNKLVQQGCPADDPFVQELKGRYETIVAEENAAKLAQYYQENPGDHGISLYKEGNYSQALQKFEEGIEKEKAGGNDSEKLANYYFYMASIEFRQLNRFSAAREHARAAARYKSNWGQPYMLIGDMYAASSNSCGSDGFDASLAVIAAIDKYSYAKSIDGDVAGEASSKIGRYSGYLPAKEDGFMRKIAEGATMTVPCWIGETVRVRYKD
jgi:tetratricopeptide (TPR) repeat protein